MSQTISRITLLVKDYDEAIAFYTQKLDFVLVEDTQRNETKRWVIIKPKGQNSCELLLVKAKNEAQLKCVGNQTGGRIFGFLYTDNFDVDYLNLLANDVTIVRDKSIEDFGKVCVFADLYGNKWDFIEPK